uniref:Uncharacterized protein n=1 Tax=Chromera velia CCMP2878 TaxID=1169474 RepID=A0A0G4HVD0_9ALVE|eukprot:Cvel_32231.t1-p1 / transcript=Cvel_32231.t1 / gene=Cvel_32231 / organism=Chromera_velia_CCMP2878 / gene_product=hypothetical protein / transcript_product=hypothetical protein / location=Cvel_scaffold4968:1372-3337(+) / protein_length=590 / sequence_SO=supercontig / SO=protein_coding / is_pseudo=false
MPAPKRSERQRRRPDFSQRSKYTKPISSDLRERLVREEREAREEADVDNPVVQFDMQSKQMEDAWNTVVNDFGQQFLTFQFQTAKYIDTQMTPAKSRWKMAMAQMKAERAAKEGKGSLFAQIGAAKKAEREGRLEDIDEEGSDLERAGKGVDEKDQAAAAKALGLFGKQKGGAKKPNKFLEQMKKKAKKENPEKLAISKMAGGWLSMKTAARAAMMSGKAAWAPCTGSSSSSSAPSDGGASSSSNDSPPRAAPSLLAVPTKGKKSQPPVGGVKAKQGGLSMRSALSALQEKSTKLPKEEAEASDGTDPDTERDAAPIPRASDRVPSGALSGEASDGSRLTENTRLAKKAARSGASSHSPTGSQTSPAARSSGISPMAAAAGGGGGKQKDVSDTEPQTKEEVHTKTKKLPPTETLTTEEPTEAKGVARPSVMGAATLDDPASRRKAREREKEKSRLAESADSETKKNQDETPAGAREREREKRSLFGQKARTERENGKGTELSSSSLAPPSPSPNPPRETEGGDGETREASLTSSAKNKEAAKSADSPPQAQAAPTRSAAAARGGVRSGADVSSALGDIRKSLGGIRKAEQ